MKEILTTLILISTLSFSQTYTGFDNLDINQYNVRINSNGDNFWNHTNQSQIFIPKNEGKTASFTQSLWFSAFDANETLHYSGDRYCVNGNFSPGPIANNFDNNFDNTYDKVFKVNKSTIDNHIINFNTSGYIVPDEILSWPGNGNTSNNEAEQLAPYVDYNGNDIYDPENGDYPCIKGDQALYIIYNDIREDNNTSKGLPLNIEIHCMVYAFNHPNTVIDSTFFMSYKIYNRSNNDYHNIKVGNFNDFDLGSAFDDHVGCDTNRNAFYVYNGSNTDGTGNGQTYGSAPPAFGCFFLNKKMSNFMNFWNDASILGSPDSIGYHYLMHSKWKDGTKLTYGGTGYGGSDTTNYMFSGFFPPEGGTSNQNNWTEITENNTPGDRRSVGSISFEALPANQSISFDMAYVYARSDSNITSIYALKNSIDEVQQFYDNNDFGCEMNLSGSVLSNGNPFNHAYVELYNHLDSTFILSTSELESGLFCFKNLDIGEYKVKAVPIPPYSQDYLQTYYGDELNFLNAYSIDFSGETYSVDIHLENTININEIEQKKYSIYPNPSSDYIYLESETENLEGKNIKLLSTTGAIVLEKNIKHNESIDISHLPNGLYTIKIDSSSYKLIKQ